MKNIPVLYWVLLALAVFGLFYFRSKAKTEAQTSSNSTQKSFSSGQQSVTYSDLIASMQK